MRWKPRFSLLTLLLAAVCTGCGLLLWRNWAPWQFEREFLLSEDGNDTPVSGDDTVSRYLRDVQLRHRVSRQIPSGSGSAYSHDASLYVTWSESTDGEQRLEVWSTETCLRITALNTEFLGRYGHGDGAGAPDLGFSADNRTLFAGGVLYKFRVSDYGMPIGNQGLADRLGISNEPDFRLRAASARQDALKAQNLNDFMLAVRLLDVKTEVSPTGKWLVTSINKESTSQVWDLTSGKRLSELNFNMYLGLESPRFYLNDERILLTSGRGLSIVDVRSGATEALPSSLTTIFAFMSKDGNRMLLDESARACVWDVRQKRALFSIKTFADNNSRLWLGPISPDGRQVLVQPAPFGEMHGQNSAPPIRQIIDIESNETVAVLNEPSVLLISQFLDDNEHLVSHGQRSVTIWQRRRPERWWGIAWLPEFWALVVCAAALIWSIQRDRKLLMQKHISKPNNPS